MEELAQILREHATRYPKMQPTDAVKLIYQNTFGGGHLIKDETACLRYLQEEYAFVKKDPAVPRMESIGNGICRVNLAPLAAKDLEKLGQVFLRSAAAHSGTITDFLSKLSVLEQLTREGVFAFGEEALASYLTAYQKQGYPPVSHSSIYREAYQPAYRVVKTGMITD